MRFQTLPFVLSFAAAVTADMAEVPSTTVPVPACTATSHTGMGGFYDLRPDMAIVPDKTSSKYAVTKDYFSKGYDYGKNFTLNLCGAVVEPVTNVYGVEPPLWQNVSAYYQVGGEVFSIGLV